MKKIFHYFCAIILVVFMGTFISSCSDDDNESNGGMHGKKLLQFNGIDFIYSDDGKLQETPGIRDGVYYTWSQNSVICKKEEGSTFYTALLSNNKIIHFKGIDYTYEKNRLVQATDGYNTYTYTWTNGNVTNIHCSNSISKNYGDYNISYYSDKKGNKAIENYIYFDFDFGYPKINYRDVWLIIAHPWLMGDSNKNLIKNIVGTYFYYGKYEPTEASFEYEFDKDGYPITITNDYDTWSTNLIWGE